MKLKNICIAVVALALAAGMTACGGTSTAAASSTSEAASASTTAVSEAASSEAASSEAAGKQTIFSLDDMADKTVGVQLGTSADIMLQEDQAELAATFSGGAAVTFEDYNVCFTERLLHFHA